jgi:hypothetical protein
LGLFVRLRKERTRRPDRRRDTMRAGGALGPGEADRTTERMDSDDPAATYLPGLAPGGGTTDSVTVQLRLRIEYGTARPDPFGVFGAREWVSPAPAPPGMRSTSWHVLNMEKKSDNRVHGYFVWTRKFECFKSHRVPASQASECQIANPRPSQPRLSPSGQVRGQIGSLFRRTWRARSLRLLVQLRLLTCRVHAGHPRAQAMATLLSRLVVRRRRSSWHKFGMQPRNRTEARGMEQKTAESAGGLRPGPR